MEQIADLSPQDHDVRLYLVRLARFTSQGWASFGPRLRAQMSSQRLILEPLTERTLKPAVIPLRAIRRVWRLSLNDLDVVLLLLSNGQRIHLLVESSDEAARFTAPFADTTGFTL